MDPQSQQTANALAGLGAGFFLFFCLIVVAILAFLVFLLWRIFTKAGMSGALAFLLFVPGVGLLIVLCVLAFGDWKVVPVAQGYMGGGGGGGTFSPPSDMEYPRHQEFPPKTYPPTT